ncbi:MAG: DNA alkylation repair protein [Methanoregula sp.]|jgi:3-methyladenine DNA glycosylase AlkD
MDPVIAQIKSDLAGMAEPRIRESAQRFFKEEISCHGVSTPVVGKLAQKYWKQVKTRDKQEIFALCEELYRSGYCEEAFVAAGWVPHLKDRFVPEDLPVFRTWIETYITNWAMCDGFCNHSMGEFFDKYPDLASELLDWARSKNRWMRRASAVSLIIPAKHGRFLTEAFAIADILLTDTDDMVQKGYGWLLKEESRNHCQKVFSYIMKNKKQMPRTALRYAIELMPQDLKAEAMKKEW